MCRANVGLLPTRVTHTLSLSLSYMSYLSLRIKNKIFLVTFLKELVTHLDQSTIHGYTVTQSDPTLIFLCLTGLSHISHFLLELCCVFLGQWPVVGGDEGFFFFVEDQSPNTIEALQQLPCSQPAK